MTNIALILFSNKEEYDKKLKFFKRAYLKIKRFFSIKFTDIPIKKVEVNTELNIYFIKVKYTLNETNEFRSFKIKRLKKAIYKCFMQNSLDKCILPVLALESLEFNDCIKNPFSGYFIYTALLVNILEIIADKKDISIKALEITIIEEENNLFRSYIKLLSPLVKFITVITNKKKYIQEEIEDIYNETGLSIRLTDDIESGLDNVDVVINLGDIENFKKGKKIRSDAIVINYGVANSEEIIFDNIVINSISIKFSSSIESILEQNAISCFTRLELASIIFCHEKEIYTNTNVNKNNVDNRIINDICSKFLKSGYKITALTGSFRGAECENLELRI